MDFIGCIGVIQQKHLMSLKSIIRDFRGEVGSRSMEGSGHGLRSRSHRVVRDSSLVAVVDIIEQSCWANMPPELLRDVLTRIEGSENLWPSRKDVVACAGVCRSWREIMKEVVKPPEVSSRLTFPISLKQPGPRGSFIQCFIKRNRGSQTFHLYLGFGPASYEDGKFLLAARKCRRPTCNDYIISLNPKCVAKGSSTYIGKLRSNFLGTKFTIYDAQFSETKSKLTKCSSTRLVGFKQVSAQVPSINLPVAHILYDTNALGSRGPRRMHCIMDSIPASAIGQGGEAPTQTAFIDGSADSLRPIPFFRSKSTRPENVHSAPVSSLTGEALIMKNKSPRWHDQLQCWCLNFNGRVTVASVKNFQLSALLENGSEYEDVILQFGKVEKDVFTMDFQYPISTFQAFAICLSSFDTKIGCE